jgi:putative hydrolase of the HAD superfamily
LYAAITARLGVPPEDCRYVGDGGGRELTGARAAGMVQILVTNAAAPGAARYRSDPGDFAADRAVDDLPAVLAMVERAQPPVG